MTRMRKGAVAAVIVFVLTAAVVLGGMTWATVLQFEVAGSHAIRRHRGNLADALWRMDSAFSAILGSEAARPFTDYVAFHSAAPVAAWTGDDELHDVETVALPSPLALAGAPRDWIDLYFMVDEDGDWSSPQLWDESIIPATWEDPPAPSYKAATMLDWLERSLPVGQVPERIAMALERDRAPYESPGDGRERTVQIMRRMASAGSDSRTALRTEYQLRAESKKATQRQVRPQPQCVMLNHLHHIKALEQGTGIFACLPPTQVGVSSDPMAAFWIDPPPGAGPKLAFMRAGHQDDKVVYQGFIADWDTLKPSLLERIDDLFPDADLEPYTVAGPVDPAVSETLLSTIPARLAGPGTVFAGFSEAYRSVAGVLTLAWIVALTVLAVAGIGVRNLVALTNRRLQFAYAVTHELRTPLTTFRLYSDMLAAGLVPDESKQEYLDTLNRESMRLSSLVQGVLEYARLENQKVRLNPVNVDAPTLMGRISQTLDERCDRGHVSPAAENAVDNGLAIHTDLDLLNQIAGVLVDNAVRHAAGTDNATVSVRLSGGNGKLCLDVVDTGPGVASADTRTSSSRFGAVAMPKPEPGAGSGWAWRWLETGRSSSADDSTLSRLTTRNSAGRISA